MAETVTVEFALRVGEGELAASATVPAGRTTLTELLPVIQALDNAVVNSAIAEELSEGRTISCKAGCGACCRQMVPISIFEAEALGDWVRTLPVERQTELGQRFHLALQALGRSGMIDRLVTENWFADTEASRRMAMDYLYQRVACPFLEDESCSIHPMRPLICREYLVTSPAEHCANPAEAGVAPVKLPLHLERVLCRMGAELEEDGRGWIPLVFLLAWMESGARPGEAIAGDGPEVLYEFVRRLA